MSPLTTEVSFSETPPGSREIFGMALQNLTCLGKLTLSALCILEGSRTSDAVIAFGTLVSALPQRTMRTLNWNRNDWMEVVSDSRGPNGSNGQIAAFVEWPNPFRVQQENILQM